MEWKRDAGQGREVQSNGIALHRGAMEGPRIVQQCDGRAVKSEAAQRQSGETLSKGNAQRCKAMQWNGSERYRIAAEWRSTAMLDVATEMQ